MTTMMIYHDEEHGIVVYKKEPHNCFCHHPQLHCSTIAVLHQDFYTNPILHDCSNTLSIPCCYNVQSYSTSPLLQYHNIARMLLNHYNIMLLLQYYHNTIAILLPQYQYYMNAPTLCQYHVATVYNLIPQAHCCTITILHECCSTTTTLCYCSNTTIILLQYCCHNITTIGLPTALLRQYDSNTLAILLQY